MRVLLLVASMDVGGAETHVSELALALLRAGHSVTVASSGGELAEKLREKGVFHVSLSLDKRALFSLIRARTGLKRLVREGNFDIVHAHSRIAAFLAHGVCRRTGVRFVSTVHARFRESRILDSLSRWGSGVICVSYDLYRYVLTVGKGIPIENVRVIPNGIDTRRFLPSTEDSSSLAVAFLSRLDEDCSAAAFSLCRIAEGLAERYPQMHILIGGGGSEYARIKKLAEQVNAREGRQLISVCGRIDDTADFLRNSDIFVGVSRAALEAMSCALPVILAGNEGFLGALDEHNIPIANSTNFCCRGYRKLDDEALLSSVCALANMPSHERERLGLRMREYVEKTHSADAMASATAELYKAVKAPSKHCKGGILLCGYYGFGNMGDDLLIVRAAQRAREKYGNIALCALTATSRRDRDRFCIRCASRKNVFTLMQEIRKAAVVVLGGGTLLQNDTSRRSLVYYLFILRYDQRRGKRTELWANGIGEIRGRVFRRAAARALGECDYIGVRDKLSAERAGKLLCEHGRSAHIVLERDLASTYRPPNIGVREDILLGELLGDTDKRFALILPRGVDDEGIETLYRIAQSARADGLSLVFAAMYPAQDADACRDMSRALSGVFADKISLPLLCMLIKNASMVCSMRYHALVLAHNAGVRFVGVGNEDKIKSFCLENDGVYFDNE